MEEEINNLRNQAFFQINEAKNIDDLEKIRVNYLGRNGKISKYIKHLKTIPNEKRKQIGALINETKYVITSQLTAKRNLIKNKAREWMDLTVPGEKIETGSLHILTYAIEEISSLFEKIGFIRKRYREVEWDYYAFESLNFEKWHPARDDWETFFVDAKDHPKYGPMLLTPHTSSAQVREMQNAIKSGDKAVKMINISKTFRRQSDASHVPMFHQFEGLFVDKEVSLSNLKGTIDYFIQNFFEGKREARLRPYYFPFTEPSFEIDISCDICNKRGCKVCKDGWLELGGAGMVHPNVLKNGGFDPKEYRGFAFGWGVERVFMMKKNLGIDDIRTVYSTDLRYLKQF